MTEKKYHALSWIMPYPADCGARNKSDRDVWLRRVLGSIPAGRRILDAGAGELRYRSLCAHLEYVSQDFARYDGRGDSRGLQMGTWDQTQLDIVSDITDIPQPDASFDAVMCVEVLEHLPRPVEALRELVRLLKPGGVLILTAPFCSLTHYAPYFFQTGYSRYFFEHWLDELGLDIVEMEHNGNYFEYLAQEVRRLPSTVRRYTDEAWGWKEKVAVRLLLSALRRFSDHDAGSSELLAYGIHVLARKRESGCF